MRCGASLQLSISQFDLLFSICQTCISNIVQTVQPWKCVKADRGKSLLTLWNSPPCYTTLPCYSSPDLCFNQTLVFYITVVISLLSSARLLWMLVLWMIQLWGVHTHLPCFRTHPPATHVQHFFHNPLLASSPPLLSSLSKFWIAQSETHVCVILLIHTPHLALLDKSFGLSECQRWNHKSDWGL